MKGISPVFRAPLIIIIMLQGTAALPAEPLYSPTWGFSLDLPEGYQFTGGDGKDRFAFESPEGAHFDLAVYAPGTYASAEVAADDLGRRIRNRGEKTGFEYRGNPAVFLELDLPDPAGGGRTGSGLKGWGLCLEMAPVEDRKTGGFLLALAYGPASKEGLDMLHLSALDSIAPGPAERRFPGPVTSFAYPRGELKPVNLALAGGEALMAEHDAEAAQALVDREFKILQLYAEGPRWQEAWIRFYRAIYRDSFERLAETAFALERRWGGGRLSFLGASVAGDLPQKGVAPGDAPSPWDFAEKILRWVQSFEYERNFRGSDFVNPVSAAAEGRGDCDSRALLWAIILERANIPAALMVSREYGHAMGLADLPGPGARFPAKGTQWLVAETTAAVGLGLIGQNQSDPAKWLGVIFE